MKTEVSTIMASHTIATLKLANTLKHDMIVDWICKQHMPPPHNTLLTNLHASVVNDHGLEFNFRVEFCDLLTCVEEHTVGQLSACG